MGMLRAHGIERIVDVRTAPRSRFNPQFNREEFHATLESEGIEYRHMKDLGGWRRPRPDSPNAALTNPGFRGYADYMLTEAFDRALRDLIELGREKKTAVLCAEAVPWRCHRSLVADALAVRGARVEHIIGESRSSPHRVTPFAVVQGTRVTYPGDERTDLGEAPSAARARPRRPAPLPAEPGTGFAPRGRQCTRVKKP